MASLLIKETLQLFHENCAIKLSEAFGVLQVWKTMWCIAVFRSTKTPFLWIKSMTKVNRSV